MKQLITIITIINYWNLKCTHSTHTHNIFPSAYIVWCDIDNSERDRWINKISTDCTQIHTLARTRKIQMRILHFHLFDMSSHSEPVVLPFIAIYSTVDVINSIFRGNQLIWIFGIFFSLVISKNQRSHFVNHLIWFMNATHINHMYVLIAYAFSLKTKKKSTANARYQPSQCVTLWQYLCRKKNWIYCFAFEQTAVYVVLISHSLQNVHFCCKLIVQHSIFRLMTFNSNCFWYMNQMHHQTYSI